MAITTHFVDNEWALQSRIIRFAHVQCPHASVVLADAMMDCILDWHLEKNVFALTVNNCRTNNAMIPIILDKPSRDSTLLNGEMFHMCCSTHILNLVVNEGLDVIKDNIDRIRGSVSYWTRSLKREEKFLETVRELEILLEFGGLMVVATILDPRFKIKIIDCYFPIIYGDRASGEIKKAQDILLRIVKEYEGNLKASSYSSSGDPTIVSSSQPIMVHSRLNPLSVFDQFLSLAPSVTTQMKTELDYYLDILVIPRADNFDILMWWNVNASKYPTLQCIASDILAIPVSTVSYESAFSTGGRFVSPHRSRLHAQDNRDINVYSRLVMDSIKWYEYFIVY
ncbi:hypothetical protein Ddye_007216 [Dipteronia dyeriana]|uniref:Transposase n=1 Tax=Dipteronia dyeriana TaxID=168575 RepID=A0AAD9XKI9_9ROSI|nr:hypothetical protein Ddye_007216 [Dipteronia dyeriana]